MCAKPLRKYAYSNVLRILPPKNENFQKKKKIDCGYLLEPRRRGGFNEYTQSIFWAEIRNIMYTPSYIKVGFKGVKII